MKAEGRKLKAACVLLLVLKNAEYQTPNTLYFHFPCAVAAVSGIWHSAF